MALGNIHDQSTRFWCIPFGLCVAFFLGIKSGVISCFAFVLGGLWLSPDLDIQSKPLKRWGIFQLIWWPYQKIIPHRSILSHGLLLGTLIRVTYLIGIFLLLNQIFSSLGTPYAWEAAYSLKLELQKHPKEVTKQIIEENPQNALAILIGLEASAWLHLIKDGYPFSKG